jgi:hypothetical protein
MADGITSLDALNWGATSPAAETALTLGNDRRDVRNPPDNSYIWGAQINAAKNLLQKISTTFQGGGRLGVEKLQTANPFGANEHGFYIASGGTPTVVVSGAPSSLMVGTGGLASNSGLQISGSASTPIAASQKGYWADTVGNPKFDPGTTPTGVGLLMGSENHRPVSRYASLNSLVAAVGSSTATEILLDKDTTLSGTLTLTPNFSIRPGVGKINLNGFNLVIQGDVRGHRRQIFTNFTTTSVQFTTLYCRTEKIFPEWWGALGDGTTDDNAAIHAAIQAARHPSGSMVGDRELSFGAGIFPYSAQIDLTLIRTLRISGAHGGIGAIDPGAPTILKYTGSGSTSAVVFASATGLLVENIHFTYNSASFTGVLLDFTSPSRSGLDAAFNIFRNCTFTGDKDTAGAYNCKALVLLANAVSNHFVNCNFKKAKVAVMFREINTQYSNMNVVHGGWFEDFSVAGAANLGQACSLAYITGEVYNHYGTPTMAPFYAELFSSGQHSPGQNEGDWNTSSSIEHCWIGDGDDTVNAIDMGTGVTAYSMVIKNNIIGGKVKLGPMIGAEISGNEINRNWTFTAGVTCYGTRIVGNHIVTPPGGPPTLTNLPTTGVTLLGNVAVDGTTTDASWNDQLRLRAGGLLDIDGGGSFPIGPTAGALVLGAANSTQYLGSPSVSGTGKTLTRNNILLQANDATAGATVKDSPKEYFWGQYWTGSATNTYDMYIQGLMETTTPTGRIATFIGGVERFKVSSDGTARAQHWGGFNTSPVLSSTGTAAQLGTTPAVAISGTDYSGVFQLTVGTGPTAFVANTNVTVARYTYGLAYTGSPPCLILVPCNAAAAYAVSQGMIFFADKANSNSSTLQFSVISSGTPTLTASAVLQFAYMTTA